MHAFDRQTDRRTDRRTEISSLRPRCIPCSAVKTTFPHSLWAQVRCLRIVIVLIMDQSLSIGISVHRLLCCILLYYCLKWACETNLHHHDHVTHTPIVSNVNDDSDFSVHGINFSNCVLQGSSFVC